MSALACYEQLKSHSLVREGDFTAMWFAFNCQCVFGIREESPGHIPVYQNLSDFTSLHGLGDRSDH